MPPPFDVSIASNIDTTSAISGRLSGFASQQRFITFAKELGQQRGISGLKFCSPRDIYCPLAQNSAAKNEYEIGMLETRCFFTCRTTADVTSEKLKSGYGISQQYISHKHIPKL